MESRNTGNQIARPSSISSAAPSSASRPPLQSASPPPSLPPLAAAGRGPVVRIRTASPPPAPPRRPPTPAGRGRISQARSARPDRPAAPPPPPRRAVRLLPRAVAGSARPGSTPVARRLQLRRVAAAKSHGTTRDWNP
ncbi:hypothetical protein BS78_K096600 [Paspalum vaginatum]|uniref:Uncharacterized protein n=1 Tax=Paspalum vaginatum TaxID=158149 RepID=A0A9W7XC51_9POAL|nr:hypothetical protein BS78_K096600 [Paspalum vaginatum]